MKSPIKDKPLRNPGESLDRKLRDVFTDDVLVYFFVALFLFVLAVLEWGRWYFLNPPSPIIYSIMAVVALAVFGWKIRTALSKVKRLKQGRDGEKAVGQILEGLRENGAHVFHDIPGQGFNIDHVVIHSSGIYVIETKTLSKPDRGETKLLFDGESISKRGTALPRNPITQVQASGKWLDDLIKESTGRGFRVQLVVVFPGWYIERTAEAKRSDVWVLNEKALLKFIANSRERMKSEDVNLCSYHLGRYIRGAQA